MNKFVLIISVTIGLSLGCEQKGEIDSINRFLLADNNFDRKMVLKFHKDVSARAVTGEVRGNDLLLVACDLGNPDTELAFSASEALLRAGPAASPFVLLVARSGNYQYSVNAAGLLKHWNIKSEEFAESALKNLCFYSKYSEGKKYNDEWNIVSYLKFCYGGNGVVAEKLKTKIWDDGGLFLKGSIFAEFASTDQDFYEKNYKYFFSSLTRASEEELIFVFQRFRTVGRLDDLCSLVVSAVNPEKYPSVVLIVFRMFIEGKRKCPIIHDWVRQIHVDAVKAGAIDLARDAEILLSDAGL